jgi:hypothetical protein
MATDTNTKQPRITYPLTVQEVEKLESLEKQLKSAADGAAAGNRVGFHRAYLALMRNASRITTRERTRMKREELAASNRRQEEMQKKAMQNPASQNAPQDAPQDDGSTN